MRFFHHVFSKPIIFRENKVNLLVIENKKLFANFVRDFTVQSRGEEGEILLSDDVSDLDFEKHAEVIADYFSLDFNGKKLSSKLITELKQSALYGFAGETGELLGLLNSFGSKVISSVEFPLEWETVDDIGAVLKLFDYRLNVISENPLEMLVDYMEVCSHFLKKDIFVLVNLKSYFDMEEIKLLYKEAFFRKWNLIVLEPSSSGSLQEYEDIVIIDKDICEIRIDNEEFL